MASEIVPAVLGHDEGEFTQQLNAIPAEIPLIQIDVLDNDVFVDPHRAFEAHLMVEKPIEIMEKWIKRGAVRVIVHKLSPEILDYRASAEIGLGVEMSVPIEKVLEQAPRVDFVQFMSIDIMGEQGQPFNPKVFDRIRELKSKYPHLPVSVDGGVSLENYKELEIAGADRLVVGSHFKELWQILQMKK